jgi:hypothetical protein
MFEQQRVMESMLSLGAGMEHTYRRAIADVARISRWLSESPVIPIIQKMNDSKGLMKGMKSAESVMFIPNAVLFYGFGHVPSESDPEGKQFEKLEQPPSKGQLETGTYLFTPPSDTKKHPASTQANDDYLAQARSHYHGKGIHPDMVFETLMMTPGLGDVWVALNVDEDIIPQFKSFQKWLNAFRRELHRRPGKRGYDKREAARDTLIFTLKESGGLKSREIAKQLFDVYSKQNASELDARVRQSLTRTRTALKAAGYDARKRSVTE